MKIEKQLKMEKAAYSGEQEFWDKND